MNTKYTLSVIIALAACMWLLSPYAMAQERTPGDPRPDRGTPAQSPDPGVSPPERGQGVTPPAQTGHSDERRPDRPPQASREERRDTPNVQNEGRTRHTQDSALTKSTMSKAKILTTNEAAGSKWKTPCGSPKCPEIYTSKARGIQRSGADAVNTQSSSSSARSSYSRVRRSDTVPVNSGGFRGQAFGAPATSSTSRLHESSGVSNRAFQSRSSGGGGRSHRR